MNHNDNRLPVDLSEPYTKKTRKYLYWAVSFIMYLFAIEFLLGKATFPHTIITLDANEHREVINGAVQKFEWYYPNSKTRLSSLIPEEWEPKKTRYSFYNRKICREIEGMEPICDKADGENIPLGLLGQFAMQIATVEPTDDTARDWKLAAQAAFKGDSESVELRYGCEWTDSLVSLYRCFDKKSSLRFYLEGYFFDVYMIVVVPCVLEVISAFFCLFKVTRGGASCFRACSSFFFWISFVMYFTFDCARYFGLEILKSNGKSLSRGDQFGTDVSFYIWALFHPFFLWFTREGNYFRYTYEYDNPRRN